MANKPSITQADTGVSMLGEGYKDYWAGRARGGDLRAFIKLACCYEMTGETGEGLIVINDFLERSDLSSELRSEGLLRKAVLQMDSPAAAWKTINQATLEVHDDELKGKIYNQRGRILSCLKRLDPAIIEYTAAAYYFEMVGSSDLLGHTHNNLAGVYRKLKRFADAHIAVDKSITLWAAYEYLPHALDHKALIYLDQRDYQAAYGLAVDAVSSAGDHHRWRAEFLCTLSRAQAGIGEFVSALCSIDGALKIADYLSDEQLRLVIFTARKASLEIMWQAANESVLYLALKLSAGNARQAAKKLGVNHSVINKAIKKHPHLKPAPRN